MDKPPKLAAVTLSIPTRSKTSLCDAMAEGKRKIRLDDLGITEVKSKSAITGGLIIEIPGENSEERADKLCNAMKAALSHIDVRVARLTKTCEIRIRGLDNSVTPEEVAEAIASAVGCRPNAVSAGPTRASSSGLNSVLVRCSVSAAKKVADVGTLRVSESDEVLERRPFHCHRCLRRGHVLNQYTYTAPEKNRRGRCYDGRDHQARGCTKSRGTMS